MGLEHIIQKSEIIDTPRAADLASSPEEWQQRFLTHVSTHVAIADLNDKWEKIIANLERGKSATGLIFAETGYGKTSTTAALWHYAEEKEIVAVPPFMWDSIADMLIATHGWVWYRLKSTRPDLLTELQQEYEKLIQIGFEDIAKRLSSAESVSIESAKGILRRLRDDGIVADSISANRLLDYLKAAVSMLLKAGYKGILILPDEFELFANSNPDIAKNFSELKDLIFPIFQQDSLPIGLIVSTYNRTYSDIQMREPYMLARFDKPKGSVINLEQVYGTKETGRSFADELWEKLSISCQLSIQEREAISEDVLLALGQFLTHPRTTSLISGPRSVVTTFRQAAKIYHEKKRQYSIFDFCEDYISHRICWNQQETETIKTYHAIMAQPIVNSEIKKQIVKLLCVFPDGIPDEMFRKHGIEETEKQALVQDLLGTYVITTVIGPTLVNYKPNSGTVDSLVEILKELKYKYNPADPGTYRAAVKAFVNHIIPEVFNQSQGASPVGWTGLKHKDTDIEPFFQMLLKGTSLPDFPQRDLLVHVATEKYQQISGRYKQSQLITSFILDMQNKRANECEVLNNRLNFYFDVTHPIDPGEIPKEISKLGDLFLPESVTPLLLLCMLDFFDAESTKSQIERLKQGPGINLLKSQIRNELIKYFFSQAVKHSAMKDLPDIDKVPIGKNFVEKTLAVLIRNLFPLYRSVSFSHQWVRVLTTYAQFLKKEERLAIRKGVEPLKMVNAEVLNRFHIKSHTTFATTYYPDGVWRDLLQVDEIDQNGNTVRERIEVRSNQTPVALYFTLHSLEERLLEQLEQSSLTITVHGKETNAIKLPEFFKQEHDNGYLDEEIQHLLEISIARGVVDKIEQKGIAYLYLVKTEISFAELQTRFEHLDTLCQLAQQKGFTITWNPGESLSDIRKLTEQKDIQDDELKKDALYQKLRAAEEHLKLKCAEWLKTETDKLRQKRYEVGTLSQTDVPKLLAKGEGFPNVDFSQLLFMDIRSQIREKYHAFPGKSDSLQKRIDTLLNKKISYYKEHQEEKTAILTAADLQEFRLTLNAQIKQLETSQTEMQQLYELFINWRNLAGLVERTRSVMIGIKDNEEIKNLVGRLDEEQYRIKQHLADRNTPLAQVLNEHEYFTNIISSIEEEFHQITRRTEDDFITFRAAIEEQLRRIDSISKPDIDEQYNPNDEEGCYRRTREKTTEKIQQWVITPAEQSINELKTDLLKPKEVFTVDETVKNQAIALENRIVEFEKRIHVLQDELYPESIEERLAEIVASVLSLREDGAEIFEANRNIQTNLQSDKEELSSEAQFLLDFIESQPKDFTQLVIQLRASESQKFPDTSQIVKSLEELYQKNWISIQVSLPGQQEL
jgi:hypothetical protein